MKDHELAAHKWLSRMWIKKDMINQLRAQAEDILGAKIPAYDSDKVPGGSDPNPTESKNIEYAMLMAEIEKRENELATENIRTYNVINNLKDSRLQVILYARYVRHLLWRQVEKEARYEHQRCNELWHKALDEVYPFIPKGDEEDGEEL